MDSHINEISFKNEIVNCVLMCENEPVTPIEVNLGLKNMVKPFAFSDQIILYDRAITHDRE